MSRVEDHIEHASRIQVALDHLRGDPERFSEWIVTTAFYKAVHLVEAVFVQLGLECSFNHDTRLESLRKDGRFNGFSPQFKQLYECSYAAR